VTLTLDFLDVTAHTQPCDVGVTAAKRSRNVAKVFKVKRDAQAWLDERAHERITGNLTDRRAARQTFRELWDEVHRSLEYAPATVALHEHVWSHLTDLAGRPIGDINAGDVSRVLARISKPSMREKARLVVSTMFNVAIAQRRVNLNQRSACPEPRPGPRGSESGTPPPRKRFAG
jgi:hypothetical protein